MACAGRLGVGGRLSDRSSLRWNFVLANREGFLYNVTCTGRCDGIGRRSGLKIHRWRQRTGSSPVTGTTSEQTSYRLLRLFYKSQSALILLLLLSKPNPLSLGFGLGPPLCGGFVLLQENIGRNQPFHIVFSPSEYIPSVDEHKSSGAGTIKCRTARNRWEGVRFSWTVSHTDVSLKGVVPDGRKKQAYPACAHCQEWMK